MKEVTLFALLWIFSSISMNTSAQTNRPAINNAAYEDIFYHTVERGQTVYSIAKMYDVEPEDIHRLNYGSDETIKADDKLKIPQKSSSKTAVSKLNSDGSYIYHTIQTKETLYGLSKQYGVSGKSIMEANQGLSYASFSTGKTIRIPTEEKRKQTTEIVENPRGAKEVYYTIPGKETMYNICKTFKTSEKELLKLNPELSGGLRTGMTLRIPLRINEEDIPKATEPDPREVNAMLDARREVKHVNAAKIALFLPYNTDKKTGNATREHTIEFYEGMLLAVDSLRNMGYSTEMFVYDTGEGTAKLQKILETESQTLKEVNLIIGGVSNEQIKLIADFAKTNKIKYVIPFTSRNDEVLNNAYIFQINTPHNYLYASASYAGANLFAKYNIIFLDTKDKDPQTDLIKDFKRDLTERNISYKDVVYDATNFSKTIQDQLSTDKPNVIMPVSSSLEALTKIKTVLRMIVEKQPEYTINLFGYPIWQTYSKECLDDFHVLDTYIYSLFYADNMEPKIKAFYENYKHWYSKNPVSTTFPKYAMLGFDTGMYFFQLLQQYGENFENDLSKIDYKSLQTGFNFERVNNWGGFINTNIYIIHYQKDYTITRSDFR